MIIKVVLLLFILFAVIGVTRRYLHGDITRRELFIWLVLWLLSAVAVMLPQQTDVLAQFVGVERGADLLVYLSIFVLFFTVFKLLVKLEKLDRTITSVVRHVGIKQHNSEAKK